MKSILTSGTRKTSIARATLKEGTGKVKINNIPLEIYTPELARFKIEEPLIILPDVAKKVDINVKIHGGGVISQADAARNAIGRALLKFSNTKAVRDALLSYDRTLLVADVRQREERKPNTCGNARSKRQKSYR